MAKDAEPGAVLETSERKFQQALGRATGTNDLNCLRRSLARLAQALVEVSTQRSEYAGLLVDVYTPMDKGRFAFRINPAMWPLFRAGYVQLQLADRLALRGHPLAQWLHAFYASHRSTISLKVETLAAWCGSQASSMADFRDRLKASLNLVQEITGSITWTFDRNGNVYVEKAATGKDKYLDTKELNPRMTASEVKQCMAENEKLDAQFRSRRRAGSTQPSRPGPAPGRVSTP